MSFDTFCKYTAGAALVLLGLTLVLSIVTFSAAFILGA